MRIKQRGTRYQYGKKARARRSRALRLRVLLVLLVVGIYVGYACLRPISATFTVTLQPQSTEATRIVWPASGQAAVGIDGQGVVAVSPQEQTAPIASVTKLVTALAILEKHPLKTGEQGPQVNFGAADVAIYQDVISRDGAALPINDGQSLSEYNALAAMLLVSANNIAISMSDWAFGSEKDYATYANAMLKKLGFSHTYIAGASGLEHGTTSTPSELVRLAELTMHNPVLAEITGLDSLDIPGFPTLENSSHASKLTSNIHGIKVGLTDEAGACLVYWLDVQKNNGPAIRTYGAIIGQPNFRELQAYINRLADIVGQNITEVPLARAGDRVAVYRAVTGAQADVITTQDVRLPHWKGTELNYAVIETKEDLRLQVNVGYANAVRFPLVVRDHPRVAIAWRLTHPF